KTISLIEIEHEHGSSANDCTGEFEMPDPHETCPEKLPALRGHGWDFHHCFRTTSHQRRRRHLPVSALLEVVRRICQGGFIGAFQLPIHRLRRGPETKPRANGWLRRLGRTDE